MDCSPKQARSQPLINEGAQALNKGAPLNLTKIEKLTLGSFIFLSMVKRNQQKMKDHKIGHSVQEIYSYCDPESDWVIFRGHSIEKALDAL